MVDFKRFNIKILREANLSGATIHQIKLQNTKVQDTVLVGTSITDKDLEDTEGTPIIESRIKSAYKK